MSYIDISYERNTQFGAVLFNAAGYPIQDDANNTGANTYQDIQSRVQNEVLGSPTASDIQNAIQDAIVAYEKETFWFNSFRYFGAPGSGSDLQTVAGKEFYSDADLPALINFPHVSKIMVLAFANRYPLIQRTPQWIDDQSISVSWHGLPTDWCWEAGSIRLYPIPDGGYPLILNATMRLPPLVNPTDYNTWVNRGEPLIRFEAKRLLFKNIIRDAEQAQAMEMEIFGNPQLGRQGALGMLRRETGRRAGGGGKLRPSRGFM